MNKLSNTSSSNSLRNNIQRPLWQSPSATPMDISSDRQQHNPPIEKKTQSKRCHGNKKKRRFKKKCCARGMKPATITRKFNKKFGLNENQALKMINKDRKMENNSTLIKGNTTESNKRKKEQTNSVPRSSSELSIAQSPPKKDNEED